MFILAILILIGIFAFSQFMPELKKINFGGISGWFSKIGDNLSQETEENLNSDEFEETDEAAENDFADEDVEYVGDLQSYTLELGRSEADIQSKRTYTFYLPVDIVFELQGVDASSSILLFKKDEQELFKLSNFDYAKTDDQIDEFWPTADEYSFVGGHTNILELEDDDYEDEMYIFADTLKIDDEPVF
ncbi:MAG: hypothetical protein A2Y82_04400 [Candidatus Buchananbacteria bacterium RBG_13_36_9]|uniref:Uncharacterized protein n=1 Tax=Candidatus Buchananbacteria bacterium RBG_13_36_9 TaxID=1797530 RepID=A0A1G1XQJ7_9BACT|nr:MAG: hypothetical protein A2Y82_04400 [Candidatus Buchananbacteria bacterium RBG_13_36_9]